MRRLTARDLARQDAPIVALTAATAPMAKLLDEACDLLLVGDSLGMTVYGMETTLGVTLDMMVAHGTAVVRASRHACVVVDLPFGSYGESPAQAYRSAARVMAETGCGAVKLEGGVAMADTIAFLVARGIPVLGHVGLMPQAVHVQGGFRAQGREPDGADRVLADAAAAAAAGAFALVLEGTVAPVAARVVAASPVKVIGIGASAACAGQILVSDDLLGLFQDFTPRFVRRYAELGPQVRDAAARFAADVRARSFPAAAECFGDLPTGKA